ncbi:PepSY-associated TM helix domain-containing protein [Streptomyces roseicoloratus]|uniref:PepSY-associated TM helix domain-containing protein n=1 Tax=Streptomyces roseicoloratus TaxID=2508722 RepID=UPI001009EC22|nr:PepSY-associated TM helix domain-containing protein [Streptomyces roseicoloratus]
MTIDDLARPESSGTPTPDTPAEASAPGRAPRGWAALRPLVLRLHFYAGVLVAPFLLVAAVSGLLYALAVPAEKLVYAHELEVPVPDGGGTALPLARQVEAARAANPDGTVTAVWPGAEPGATTRVLMDDPEAPEGTSLAVFVDPYSGDVRGQLPSYGSAGALPLRTWISGLHVDLHLGEFGRNYSELAASWLWVVALGGLALWLGRRRKNRRALFLPERGPRSRRRTLSWHGSVGLWAVAGLVALSATGLTWSRYAGENIGGVQDRLGGATPQLSAAVTPGGDANGDEHAGHGTGSGSGSGSDADADADAGSGTGSGTGHGAGAGTGHHPAPAGAGGAGGSADIGLDRAVAAARAAGIDSPSISVTLPAEGSGYVVKETDKQFPVQLDSVAVNPADGAVLDELRFADYPLLAKLTRVGIDAHMGLFLGLFNQLALAALALALVLLVVWGYRMWWLRRPARRPVARGAWRRVPPTMLLPLLAATAAVGWFVPLLGLSLVAFLAVDLTVAFVARVRTRPETRSGTRPGARPGRTG